MIRTVVNHIENDSIGGLLSNYQFPHVILSVQRSYVRHLFHSVLQRKKLFPTQHCYFKDNDQVVMPSPCSSWGLKETQRFRRRHFVIDRLLFAKSINEVRDVMTKRNDENDNSSHFYLFIIPQSAEKWKMKSKPFWGTCPFTLWSIIKIGSNYLDYQKLVKFTSNYWKAKLNNIYMSVNYALVKFIIKVINTLSITEQEIKVLSSYCGLLTITTGPTCLNFTFDSSSRFESCMFKLNVLTKEPFLCWEIILDQGTEEEWVSYTLDVSSTTEKIIFVAECAIFSKTCNDLKDSTTIFEFLASDYINKKNIDDNVCNQYVKIDNKQKTETNSSYEIANKMNTLSTLLEALQSAIYGMHNKLIVSVFAFRDEGLLQILFDIFKSNIDTEVCKGCIISLVQAARKELKSTEFKRYSYRILNRVGFFICDSEQIQSMKINIYEIYFSIFGCSQCDQFVPYNHCTFDVSTSIKWKVAIWSMLIENACVGMMRTCVSGAKCFFIDNQSNTNDQRHQDNLERHLISLMRLLTAYPSNSKEIESFDLKEDIIQTLFDMVKKMSFELIRAFSFNLENAENKYIEVKASTDMTVNGPLHNVNKDQIGSQSISSIQSDGTSSESKIYSLDDLSTSNSNSISISKMKTNASLISERNSVNTIPGLITKTNRVLSKKMLGISKDNFFLPTWIDIKPIFVAVDMRSKALCIAIIFRLVVTGWRELCKDKCGGSHEVKSLQESLRSCLNMIRPIMAQISLKEIDHDNSLNHALQILHFNHCYREEEILIRLLPSSILKKRMKEHYPFVMDNDENLIKCEIIGSGKFGTIKEVSETIAVKILPWADNYEDDAEIFERMLNEICALQICSEKNMLKLYDYGILSSQVWIFLEKGKESLKMWRCRLNSTNIQTFSLCHVIRFFVQVWSQCCSLISQLHELGIIHNDIKCDNILIRRILDISDPHGNIHEALFVVDFGEALIKRNDCFNNFIFRNRSRGTERIQSPEMLTISSKSISRNISATIGDVYKKTDYPDSSSDVWSLGCLLYEIVTAEYLFDTNDWTTFYALLNYEQMGELPTSKSIDNMYQILSTCCHDSPSTELALCMTHVCELMRVCLKRSRTERKSAKSISMIATTYVFKLMNGEASSSYQLNE